MLPGDETSEKRATFIKICMSGATGAENLKKLLDNNEFSVNEYFVTGLIPQSTVYIAISYQNCDVARLLLDHGANVNAQDSYYRETALHRAVRDENLEAVQLLLEYNCNIILQNKNKDTALDIAVAILYSPGVESLLDSMFGGHRRVGKIIFVKMIDAIGCMIKKFPSDVSIKDLGLSEKGCVALCKAILDNDAAAVRTMIMRNEDEHYVVIAAWLSANIERPDIFKCLLKNAPRVDMAIFYALKLKDYDTLQFFLNNGLDENFIIQQYIDDNPDEFKNALCFAIEFYDMDLIKMLVTKYNFSIDWRDPENGFSPLRYLFEALDYYQRFNVLQFLTSYFQVIDYGKHHSSITDELTCSEYQLLMEYSGLRFETCLGQEIQRHYIRCNKRWCNTAEHLKKLATLDHESFGRVSYMFGDIPFKMLSIKTIDRVTDYELKLNHLKNYKISSGTTSQPSRTLYDFLYCDRNECIRYSKNVNLIDLYKKNNEDFKNIYHEFGFALNYQFRRACKRRELVDSARELLHYGLGMEIPSDLGEEVFQFFSDEQLNLLISD